MYSGVKDKLTLTTNEIHLWSVTPQTIQQPELLQAYSQLLSPAETIKQQRFRFEKDRHNALITRAFVRDLLSHYADVLPADWQFVKGEKDKPEIANPPLPLRFNISHTDNLIICAVMLNDDIGCDVENTLRSSNVLSIAKHSFSDSEFNDLLTQPTAQQTSRFFDYWTLKESYIKAWGLGLSIPLKDFSFTLPEGFQQQYQQEDQQENQHCIDTIKLSFAPHRIDNPNIWRHWLFYPNNTHRVALAVRARSNNQQTEYKMRFFNSTPLINITETLIFKPETNFKPDAK
ncbi:4'-phosphopantetheinyl transferase superfamily protein [Moritella marina ATCC 15381]|uniref:4'-phosphopantetheinyl transferase superfamily protein n=2 Tax=Moritella marina TaxID=90736 RepID=A0A5J6WI67_MORMI|nr:4'-phosphopantetheinyl transferase superfamily protein [Moritella marina]QFI37284.1 4'-phosphopantetheinyl transferase superfamily protein [Moritella marina ATCC 15381]BAF02836.1 4'-phosphopantetheinyl transferase [Moritella marina ATCC 15381]